MRFYKNKQTEMLFMVRFFLTENKEKLSARVPAMKEMIEQFLEMEKAVVKFKAGNPNAVKAKTGEKDLVKQAFVKQVRKLIAMLRASGYKYKNKPLQELQYSFTALNRMKPDKLIAVFNK